MIVSTSDLEVYTDFFRVRNANFNVKAILDTAHKARYDVGGGKVCNNAGLSAGYS
jgi:hypothetical protein